MAKPDPKLGLLQHLDGQIGNEGFKLIKARTAFERERGDVSDMYKLDFYSSSSGARIQPGIIMRFAALDRIYHQVSGAKPADRKYHAAVSFALWRVYGGTTKYEFLLPGEGAIPAVAEKLVQAFQDVALPFFERHSTVAAIDDLFNTAPEDPQTILYNTDAWTRCAYATIAARVAGNPDYDRLVGVYDATMKKSDGGQRHEQYVALVKLLEGVR